MRLEPTNYTLPPRTQRPARLVTDDSHPMPMPAECPAPSLPVFSCGCGPKAPLGPQGPTSAHHSPNPDKYHPPPVLNCISPLNGLNSKHEGFQRANPQALWDTPMFEGSDSIPGTRRFCTHSVLDAQSTSQVHLCGSSALVFGDQVCSLSKPPEPLKPC